MSSNRSLVRVRVASTMFHLCPEYIRSGVGPVGSSLKFVMSEQSVIVIDLSAISSNPITQMTELIQSRLYSFSRILSSQAIVLYGVDGST